MKRSSRIPHAAILWTLTVAFALGVAGQAIQNWLPQPHLPPFNDWQGSSTPYSLLLLAQLLILGLMGRTSWRIGRGISTPAPRLGRQLAWIGGIFMVVSLARIAIGLAMPSAPAWFSAWISGVFHIVLAGFLLIAAHYHLRSSAAR